MTVSPAPETILTVTALTRLIKQALETDFPAVWVKGELSGCKRAESGHLYFSIKDGNNAILDGVLFRTDAMRLAFDPHDGMEVEVFGGVTVYERRGKYQLLAREMRPGGLGALLLAFEKLKQKLRAEGLFDEARKQPLPRYPSRIGIVTSPVGAAVRDLVKVLRARWPSIAIVLAPTRVQGPGAAEEIAGAIARFNRYARVDLLIVGRGGGSLEDLWAFNEEIVVRAIAASRIPLISAVGHEVDWTLADFAADRRAATPSNAAEIAVRDHHAVARDVASFAARLRAGAIRGLAERRRLLRGLVEKYGFRRQRDALRPIQQRVDDLAARLRASVETLVRESRDRLRAIGQRYGLREWPRSLAERRDRVTACHDEMTATMVRGVHHRRARLDGLGDRLRALSPRLVLERGYCLARTPDGSLIRGVDALAVGERIAIEFARGEADARIEAVRAKGESVG